jgi:hypothetical protein
MTSTESRATWPGSGFTAPVILDERTGTLVTGHGRLDTLVRLQANSQPPPTTVQVKDGDWLISVIRGLAFPSDAERDAFLVTDNRLTKFGGPTGGLHHHPQGRQAHHSLAIRCPAGTHQARSLISSVVVVARY